MHPCGFLPAGAILLCPSVRVIYSEVFRLFAKRLSGKTGVIFFTLLGTYLNIKNIAKKSFVEMYFDL